MDTLFLKLGFVYLSTSDAFTCLIVTWSTFGFLEIFPCFLLFLSELSSGLRSSLFWASTIGIISSRFLVLEAFIFLLQESFFRRFKQCRREQEESFLVLSPLTKVIRPSHIIVNLASSHTTSEGELCFLGFFINICFAKEAEIESFGCCTLFAIICLLIEDSFIKFSLSTSLSAPFCSKSKLGCVGAQ